MLLTKKQAEGLAAVRAGLEEIERLRQSINAQIAGHDLAMRPLILPGVGQAMHKAEGIAFEHNVTASKERAARQAMPLAA